MATNKRLIKSNDEGGGGVGNSFGIITYEGTGVTQSTDTLLNQNGTIDFQPDFIWTKSISLDWDHVLADSIRGFSTVDGDVKYLTSDLDIAEFERDGLSSFDATGFTVDTYPNANDDNQTFVAWCWKAAGYANTFNVLENGSTTSSATAAGAGITAGSNTTNYSVSANRDAGFSIVRFDAGGAAWNVGHGLDVAPDVIIEKMYTFGNQWAVYHKDVGTGKYLKLSTGDSVFTDAGAFSNVTDTTWTSYTTLTSGSYIAYCFAEVAGFSKFGSYVGDGTKTGPTITTGFRPALVIIKWTDDPNSSSAWAMYSDKVNTGDVADKRLEANTNAAAITSLPTDTNVRIINFNDNGFEIAGNSGLINSLNGNYIYMAFANQF